MLPIIFLLDKPSFLWAHYIDLITIFLEARELFYSRAALGIMRDATTSAPWGASTGLGQVGAGNARTNCVRFGLRKEDRHRPALRPRPRKPGLEPRGDGRKSVAQSREWNADRRARPQRRVGASRLFVARPAPAGADSFTCVCRRSASFFFRSVHFPSPPSSSSLPGLTRQSMRSRSLLGFSDEALQAARQHGPPGQARW